jgi:hypothetical protein
MLRDLHRQHRNVLLVAVYLLLLASGAQGGTVILSDNITGVETGGTVAASGSNWLAASFGTGDWTSQLDAVTLLLENSVAGNAVVDIYSDGGLQPGSLVGTLTSPSSYLGPLVETTFTASGITLAANSTYWVVLYATSGEFDWAWAANDSGTGIGFQDTWSQSSDGGNSWFTFVGPDSYPTQMIVSASVPEPGSLTLLSIGGALLWLGQRYRGSRRTNTRAPASSNSKHVH